MQNGDFGKFPSNTHNGLTETGHNFRNWCAPAHQIESSRGTLENPSYLESVWVRRKNTPTNREILYSIDFCRGSYSVHLGPVAVQISWTRNNRYFDFRIFFFSYFFEYNNRLTNDITYTFIFCKKYTYLWNVERKYTFIK